MNIVSNSKMFKDPMPHFLAKIESIKFSPGGDYQLVPSFFL